MGFNPIKKAARKTRRLQPFRVLARWGFAVNGLLHVIIGVITIRVAFAGSGDADHSGALAQIASTPGGGILLWTVAVGLAALGLWLILGAFVIPARNTRKRVFHMVAEIGKGLAYLFLAATTFSFALGGTSNSERDVKSVTAALLAAPGGVVLLGAGAAVALGVGIYFIVKGVRRRFIEDIEMPSGKRGDTVEALGVFGYVAKGIALFAVGLLLATATFTLDPSKAGGLDGALTSVSELPLGMFILSVIGLGLIAYGAYCLVRARIAKL